MTTMNEGPTSGQVTDPSIPAPKNDVSELIAVLEKNTKAIVRIGAVLTKFGERLDALEGKSEEDAPSTERHPAGQRFALASDGNILIELSTHLIPHIQGRDVLQFVALTEAERSAALESAEHGLSETAARISGQLVKRAKGASS